VVASPMLSQRLTRIGSCANGRTGVRFHLESSIPARQGKSRVTIYYSKHLIVS
jgi:hypothetical protein